MPHWRRLDMHLASLERVLALLKAGRSMEARIAIIAITTNNSISVNARLLFVGSIIIQIRPAKRSVRVCLGRTITECYSWRLPQNGVRLKYSR
jgi:hypothetical protein